MVNSRPPLNEDHALHGGAVGLEHLAKQNQERLLMGRNFGISAFAIVVVSILIWQFYTLHNLRAEVDELKNNLSAEVDELKNNLSAEVDELKNNLSVEVNELKSQISRNRNNLDKLNLEPVR